MSAKNKKTILLLLVAAVLLAVVPFFAKKGAEFGGSDDAGSVMVEEIKGEAYEPWFTPVIESLTGSELPGEIESLIFCVQTGIGVGVIAFLMGRFYERKKREDKEEEKKIRKQNCRTDSNCAAVFIKKNFSVQDMYEILKNPWDKKILSEKVHVQPDLRRHPAKAGVSD